MIPPSSEMRKIMEEDQDDVLIQKNILIQIIVANIKTAAKNGKSFIRFTLGERNTQFAESIAKKFREQGYPVKIVDYPDCVLTIRW